MQMARIQQRKAPFRVLSRTVEDPFNMNSHCNLEGWAPFQHKLAEFRYREAIASRACETIEEALKAMPDYSESLEEQKRVRGV
ncbi:uncharacterized protein EAF01_011441 [Botrytis porri]|uniref:uncharacterized protein n=1 Tax=Botrytis porri TaxID=87229 RepID=UPI0019007C7B|nr:uncharacterized protein EAF01_011441 [Botrytis porri]KAF7885376.1 hypothetical protein EAF01_011441 [Botrytis porri]